MLLYFEATTVELLYSIISACNWAQIKGLCVIWCFQHWLRQLLLFYEICGVPLFWRRWHNPENTGCGMLLTWSEGTKLIYKSIKRFTVHAALQTWGILVDPK